MAESLDIVQLRTFVAIADCGGFGRAASALHLSQPTVSQHVRLLERRLGQTLVERAGRQAAFTAAGERLLAQARRILLVHDDALASLDVNNHQNIVIGSTETAADQILPELLTTMRDAFPERQVQFHIDRSTQMEEAVAKGAIDLAVIFGIGPDHAGRRVGTMRLDWFSSPEFVAPDASAEWPLVAYVAPCGMRQAALEALTARGRSVSVVAESTSLEGVLAAARAGLGVAVMPSSGRVPDGLIVRDDLPTLGAMTLCLVTRRGLDVDIERVALDALEDFFIAHDFTEPAPVSIHPSSF